MRSIVWMSRIRVQAIPQPTVDGSSLETVHNWPSVALGEGGDFNPTDTPSDDTCVTEEEEKPVGDPERETEEQPKCQEDDLLEHIVIMTNRYAAQFLQQQRESGTTCPCPQMEANEI
ncbi:UNVERIFIED_CONTAM: hypothetical protein FKN15_057738 [Acipenser sinensis]